MWNVDTELKVSFGFAWEMHVGDEGVKICCCSLGFATSNGCLFLPQMKVCPLQLPCKSSLFAPVSARRES